MLYFYVIFHPGGLDYLEHKDVVGSDALLRNQRLNCARMPIENKEKAEYGMSEARYYPASPRVKD